MSPLDIVVVGIGNPCRGDDAIGPLVATLSVGTGEGVRDIGPLEEPLDLLGRFDGVDLAVVIDAVRSGAALGTVRVLEVGTSQVGAREGERAVTSTHGIGLVGVLRLAHAVGRAPRRVMLVSVEGGNFELGQEMSAEVAAAVPVALAAVAHVITEERLCA